MSIRLRRTVLVGVFLIFSSGSVFAECNPSPEGFVCTANDGSGNAANVGFPISSSDGATRQSTAIALASELLEEEGEVIRETGESAGPGGGVFGLFATLLYADKDIDSSPSDVPNSAGNLGFDSDTRGGLVGVDYTKENYTLGLALDFSREEADFKRNLGTQDTDEFGIQLLGILRPQSNSFIALSFRYATLDTDSTRRTGDATTARGETDGTRYGVTGGGGYSWSVHRRTALNLSAWLDWRKNEIDGYTETGFEDARKNFLIFDDDNYSTLDGILEFNLTHAFSTGGADWFPTATLAYVHEFESDTRTIQSVTADLKSDPLSLRTNEEDKDYLRAGLSINGDFRQGTTLYARYQGTFLHDSRKDHLVSIGIRQAF